MSVCVCVCTYVSVYVVCVCAYVSVIISRTHFYKSLFEIRSPLDFLGLWTCVLCYFPVCHDYFFLKGAIE